MLVNRHVILLSVIVALSGGSLPPLAPAYAESIAPTGAPDTGTPSKWWGQIIGVNVTPAQIADIYQISQDSISKSPFQKIKNYASLGKRVNFESTYDSDYLTKVSDHIIIMRDFFVYKPKLNEPVIAANTTEPHFGVDDFTYSPDTDESKVLLFAKNSSDSYTVFLISEK